jgi:amidase
MNDTAAVPRADHYLARDEIVYSLDRDAKPRLTVDPGAVVTIETHDARAGRLKRPDQVEETTPDFSQRFPKANPATGPIFIRGAKAGDKVSVDILAIDLDPVGFVLVKPDMGVVRDLSAKPIAKICKVENGFIHFGALRIPVRPMVGVIGVAPAGDAIGTAYVGDHGGNIDTILNRVGTRMIVRAQVDGALVYVGDVHAAMGDGEVSGTGLEIGAKVTIRIGLEPGPAKRWPRLETPDRHVAIATAPTFEAASELVVREMMGDLTERYGIPATEAFMLLSTIGDLRVNQACNSKVDVSLRMEMPRL